MIRTIARTQADFYREFLMSRGINPQEYGVDLTRDQFSDLMGDEFAEYFKGVLSVDELLLHPREAIRFCDAVRQKHGFFDVPDDIILRVILKMRKNP